MINQGSIIVAGVDVSSSFLDVAVEPGGMYRRFDYNEAGFGELIVWLIEREVGLVVLEATGGLEVKLVVALDDAGIGFHVANPRQVRDFARALGKLAKTDKIDAKVIVEYGVRMKPAAQVLPSKNRQKLKAMVTRYSQLTQLRVAESNRLARMNDDEMRVMIEKMIEQINQQIEQVQVMMNEWVEDDAELSCEVDRIESVQGIGRLTSSRLVAMVPELGCCNRREIARLIGVAPVNRDSGTMRGKRTTGGGRSDVRKILYMPTIVATKHNPVIRETYLHLLAQGKPKMVALIACMRKLIIMINIMVREQKTWNELIQIT